MKRLVTASVVLVLVAGMSAWVAATLVESEPSVITAPEPSVVTAVVERKALTDVVVTRGTVVVPDRISVLAPSPVEGVSSVVTDIMVSVGETVQEGLVLIEVSDRPVFILKGPVPQYRGLFPGAEGDDVAQLQEALERLGYYKGPIDGRFGELTEAAIGEMYAGAGYEAVVSPPNLEELLAEATTALIAAEQQLESARRGLNDAKASHAVSKQEAEAAVRAAENALTATVLEGDAQVDEAELAVRQAEEEYTRVSADPESTASDIAAAEAAVINAQNELAAAKLDRDNSIEEAQDRLAIARTQLEAISMAGVAEALTSVQLATQALDDAHAAKRQLETTTGAGIPVGEVAFVPFGDATVESIGVSLGGIVTPDTELLSLSGSAAQVHAVVPRIANSLVSVDMRALIYPDDGGQALEGRILAIGPMAADTDGGSEAIAVVASDEPIQSDVGANVRVEILIEVEPESLVVPLPAVWTRGTPKTYVTRLLGEVREDIEVQVGRSAGGLIAVKDPSDTLQVGDVVIISD